MTSSNLVLPMPRFEIRPYQSADFDAVTILWRIAREKSVPEIQREKGYFFYQDRDYFAGHILPNHQVWVAARQGQPVAFMAMRDDFIDQLYVHPEHWRKGIGRALLAHARQRSPDHLWLFTLQANRMACAFYEQNGFVAERFGYSPPPESAPDVEYHWRGNAR